MKHIWLVFSNFQAKKTWHSSGENRYEDAVTDGDTAQLFWSRFKEGKSTNEDRHKISGLGRAAVSTLQVHRAMMERPITDSGWLVKKTGITPATVNK